VDLSTAELYFEDDFCVALKSVLEAAEVLLENPLFHSPLSATLFSSKKVGFDLRSELRTVGHAACTTQIRAEPHTSPNSVPQVVVAERWVLYTTAVLPWDDQVVIAANGQKKRVRICCNGAYKVLPRIQISRIH